MSSKILCSECDIPDVNCYMQCLCEEDDCDGCFGASFNDCFDCPKYGRKEGSHGLQKGRKEEEIGGNTDE